MDETSAYIQKRNYVLVKFRNDYGHGKKRNQGFW